jgi:hypothetical protein
VRVGEGDGKLEWKFIKIYSFCAVFLLQNVWFLVVFMCSCTFWGWNFVTAAPDSTETF